MAHVCRTMERAEAQGEEQVSGVVGQGLKRGRFFSKGSLVTH